MTQIRLVGSPCAANFRAGNFGAGYDPPNEGLLEGNHEMQNSDTRVLVATTVSKLPPVPLPDNNK
jgi:hypothetical protein